jgi:hypothetical protein
MNYDIGWALLCEDSGEYLRLQGCKSNFDTTKDITYKNNVFLRRQTAENKVHTMKGYMNLRVVEVKITVELA